MFRGDARPAVKIPDIERERIFVNCKECEYYMFFKPETITIL
jgi:predicted nucleic-acid-binding Zn-ribbon protein